MRLDRNKRTPRRTGSRGFVFNRERDSQILLALYKMRVLRTRDLTRLYFGAKSTAQKRLRRLFDQGYLKCWSNALTSDNLYTLDRRGRDFVRDHFGLDVRDAWYPNSLAGLNLDHLLAINAVRIELSLSLAKHPNLELALFLPEWEIRTQRNVNIAPVIPDALFRVRSRSDGREFDYALEADLGGQSIAYFRRNKIKKYLGFIRGGVPVFGIERFYVLVATTTERRAAQLAEAARTEGAEGEFLVCTFENTECGCSLADRLAESVR